MTTEPLRYELRVACPPDHAFRVFTGLLDAWWPASHRRPGSRMALEDGVGGRFVERATDGSELELGRVVRWDPPGHLAYTWRPGAPPGLTTLVEVWFDDLGGQTEVRVVHSAGAVADFAARAEAFRSRWPSVLEAYRVVAEP